MCEVKMIKAVDVIINTLQEMKVREDEVKEAAKEFQAEHLNTQGTLSKAWFDGALSAFAADRAIMMHDLDADQLAKVKSAGF